MVACHDIYVFVNYRLAIRLRHVANVSLLPYDSSFVIVGPTIIIIMFVYWRLSNAEQWHNIIA